MSLERLSLEGGGRCKGYHSNEVVVVKTAIGTAVVVTTMALERHHWNGVIPSPLIKPCQIFLNEVFFRFTSSIVRLFGGRNL